jgi:hypothetical protein
MSVTNLAAFTSYYENESRGTLVLNNNGIDPTLSDANSMASAWGMLELAKSADFRQGKTSITYSESARRQLINDAERIFKENDVEFPWDTDSVVSSIDEW